MADTRTIPILRCASTDEIADLHTALGFKVGYRPDRTPGSARAAFLTGYGGSLTPVEEEHLTAVSARDAVSGIRYGCEHGDPEPVERGRRTLAGLRA
ncbi:hypothetical protein [Embleya scabrispora]|uniref:hypothetical protein n=1 Tax=Embleya scabrispora TaxID=159449 RepID=UPI00037B2545|nr:hypothetical protein [Streptomyces sp. SID5474]